MSGRALDYFYSRLEWLIEDIEKDKKEEGREFSKEEKELINLLKDLVEVLWALEWWYSGDNGQKEFQEEYSKFKKKWLREE